MPPLLFLRLARQLLLLIGMGVLKAVTFITLWVLLSFFWVGLGESKSPCPNYGSIESWLKPYPTLNSWYRFYVDRQDCKAGDGEFLRVLASSEPLSIKLNQAEVLFDQFYVPIHDLLSINWEKVAGEETQKIQSDFSTIDHSLKKAMINMNAADQDYFRAVVLLSLSTDFAMR